MSGVHFPEFFDSVLEQELAGAIGVRAEDRGIKAFLARKRFPDEGQPILEVHPQFQLAEWRVDLLVVLRFAPDRVRGVFVECDGHEFHERTKEQAMRDRRRDRRAQSLDMPIFRFTGTEVYHDADACADELLDELMRTRGTRNR